MEERGKYAVGTFLRKGSKRLHQEGCSAVSLPAFGSELRLSKRCEPRFKKEDGFYMETDFLEKTITIGKGRKRITLNEMQAVLLAKSLSRQVRLVFGK